MSNADFDTRHTSPRPGPPAAKPPANSPKLRSERARTAQPRAIAHLAAPKTATPAARRQPQKPRIYREFTVSSARPPGPLRRAAPAVTTASTPGRPLQASSSRRPLTLPCIHPARGSCSHHRQPRVARDGDSHPTITSGEAGGADSCALSALCGFLVGDDGWMLVSTEKRALAMTPAPRAGTLRCTPGALLSRVP